MQMLQMYQTSHSHNCLVNQSKWYSNGLKCCVCGCIQDSRFQVIPLFVINTIVLLAQWSARIILFQPSLQGYSFSGLVEGKRDDEITLARRNRCVKDTGASGEANGEAPDIRVSITVHSPDFFLILDLGTIVAHLAGTEQRKFVSIP